MSCAQLSPCQPSSHTQRKPLICSMHWPWKQCGVGTSHASISTQFMPLMRKPGGHSHTKLPGALLHFAGGGQTGGVAAHSFTSSAQVAPVQPRVHAQL